MTETEIEPASFWLLTPLVNPQDQAVSGKARVTPDMPFAVGTYFFHWSNKNVRPRNARGRCITGL